MLEDAKELLRRAVSALSSQHGGGPVLKATVKPMMTRLDSSFDEANYGYKTFSDFLDNCRDVVTVHKGQHDHMIELEKASHARTSKLISPQGQHDHINELGKSSDGYSDDADNHAQDYFLAILRRQSIRLISPSLLEAGVLETYNIFANNNGTVATYAEYKTDLLSRLQNKGIQLTDADASKLKALLYKAFAFRLDTENGRIALADQVKSAEGLMQMIRSMLVRRVLDNVSGPASTSELSLFLYGDKIHTNEVDELIRIYSKSEAGVSMSKDTFSVPSF